MAANNYQIWSGASQNYTQIEYPQPNEYYDYGAILLLRSAFEHFKKADLLSDLTNHFKAMDARLPANEKIYPELAVGYLSYWNEDKDEALAALTKAAELVPSDTDMKLDLAMLREKRGERDEALALADAIDPLDNATMQKRETMALRLSVQNGDVERARKAAERLFNLRLDTETQVQLAGQMHTLAMHEMAEAVMARARRRAGNKTATLVGLMQQYQQQNQMDTALQVAHQILRKPPGQQSNPNGNNEEDTSRLQAVQTIARSGKIKDLIERAEAQLKASPNSTQLLQVLADYYKAANDREKMKATYKKIAELHPEDAKLRFQVAQQLAESGDNAGAVEHYKAAIKKEPALFSRQYWMVQNTFQAAGKNDELYALLDSLDLRQMGNVYSVTNLVQSMLRDEKTREKGMALFRKAWKTFPDERSNLMAYVSDDASWNLPEMYDYAREAALPDPNGGAMSNWAGLESIIMFMGNGKVQSVANRLLSTASRQNKLEVLNVEIEAKVKAVPEWSGGKALLGVIRTRQGRIDEARKIFDDLMKAAKDKDEPIPPVTAWLIGQELEEFSPLQPTVLALYEAAVKDEELNPYNQNGFEYSPARRLVEVYKKMGRNDDARQLILKYSSPKEDTPGYPQGYAAYQHISQVNYLAQTLNDLGFPADAVRLYTEVLGDNDSIQAASQWNGNMDQYLRQAQDGLANAIEGMNSEKTVASTLKTLRAPRANPKPGTPVLDLVLLVNPRELDRAVVTSLFAESLKVAAGKSDLLAATSADLARLGEAHPKDLSVKIAMALTAMADGKPEAIDAAVGKLRRLVEEMPLDDLSTGARPNARQRAEAQNQIGLWLVARACWKHESSRKMGDLFGSRALEAARRVTETKWALAMLRERGQDELDRGDKVAAEKTWTQMLEIVLATPFQKKPEATQTPVPAAPAPATKLATSKAAQAPKILPTPIDKFEQAAQISRLAARHGMQGLALAAIRESMSGGPPVAASSAGQFGVTTNNNRVIRYAPGQEPPDTIGVQVESRLFEVEADWRKARIDPKAVYEVFREAVLPDARPGEVFLFASSMANARSLKKPRSVAGLLASYAVASGQVDDLRHRLEGRKAQPMAELSAIVLLGMVSLEAKDEAGIAASLDDLKKRLERDSLRSTALMACLIAVPSLQVAKVEPSARSVAELAAKNLSSGAVTANNDTVLTNLLMTLGRHNFDRKDAAAGRKNLQEYLLVSEKVTGYNAEYSSYRKRMALQAVASEYLHANLVDDAMEMMGRVADTPVTRYGGSSTDETTPSLLRLISERPAAERYEMLRKWSLPAVNRKSIRLLAAFVGDDAPPKVFGNIKPLAPSRLTSYGEGAGTASTAGLLIASAIEAGKLDELAKEVESAAKERLENGELLRLLVLLARGDLATSEPGVKSLAAELKEKFRTDDKPPSQLAPTRRATTTMGKPKTIEWGEYLVARAASTHSLTASGGESMLRDMLDFARRNQNWGFQVHVNCDLIEHAIPTLPASNAGLALWHAESVASASQRSSGLEPALWIEHEGILAHVMGAADDLLTFDYPLTGTFEFSVDCYDGGWAEGQVAHGGLVYEAAVGSMDSYVHSIGRGDSIQPHFRAMARDDFNHYTIQVDPKSTRVLVNGHLFHEESSPSTTSPWLSLFSHAPRRSAWKNLQITGSPTIPREVKMTGGDRLEGWICTANEDMTKRLADEDAKRRGSKKPAPANSAIRRNSGEEAEVHVPAWSSKDGVITGKKYEAPADANYQESLDPASEVIQSRFFYQRPLRDGDAVAFEFLYEPGETIAHPTIGRTVFLLDPAGVKLRWITNGLETEWTGLRTDNVAELPAERRGEGPLPLKQGEWNSARLSVKGDVVALELNGKPIYEHTLTTGDERQFGVYHDKSRTSARFRNAVLTGHWPSSLSAEQMGNLLARGVPEGSSADKQRNEKILGEAFFATEAESVVRKSENLSAADRYAALARWVLPSEDHASIRLHGYTTPTNPPAPDKFDKHQDAPRAIGQRRAAQGGGDRIGPRREGCREARRTTRPGRGDFPLQRPDDSRAPGPAGDGPLHAR